MRSSAGPRFLVRSSLCIDQDKLKPGSRCTLNQQSLAVVDILPSSFDSQVYGMEIVETPTESYGDIGGLEQQITEIKEAVELPLKRPDLFRENRDRSPKRSASPWTTGDRKNPACTCGCT